MKLFKIILACILLIGCEKEPIQINSPKILKKYQDEVKTISKTNSKKHRLGKKSFSFSKILKTKKKKI